MWILIPASSGYGRLVGQLDMPNVGDELHHFGWNACSACLCPYAPHPHVERRYLIVPGINSSRIHIVDTKPDPRKPQIVKVIEPETLAARTGYASPHTLHCGPEGIYASALGATGGDGPGGIFVMDHDSFDILGKWELDRGPQYLAYDFWWHLGFDTVITSEWGTPNMVQHGLNPEILLKGGYGHKLHVWDLRKRRHVQELDLGAEYQMALELRPAHDPTRAYGFLGRGGVAQRSCRRPSGSGIGTAAIGAFKKSSTFPPSRPIRHKLPPLLQGFKAVPPLITDINLSLDDRFLYVSCWGTGEFLQYDVSDPFHPKKTGSIHLGGIVRNARAPIAAEDSAERRSANGRTEPRRQAHLLHKLAVLALGRAVLSRRHTKLDGETGRDSRRRHGASIRSSSWSSAICAVTRYVWKAATPRPIPTATHDRRRRLGVRCSCWARITASTPEWVGCSRSHSGCRSTARAPCCGRWCRSRSATRSRSA